MPCALHRSECSALTHSLDHPKKLRSKNSYHLRPPPPVMVEETEARCSQGHTMCIVGPVWERTMSGMAMWSTPHCPRSLATAPPSPDPSQPPYPSPLALGTQWSPSLSPRVAVREVFAKCRLESGCLLMNSLQVLSSRPPE